MGKINQILTLTTVAVVMINMALCADFFESILLRLNCYGTEQPGCDTEFIDAYPELGWSYLNLTQATTHFYMFSNDNPDQPELMHKCAGELPPDTKFNPECPTEVFIPGYVSGICNYAIFRELKNEILKSGCYNVLLVDYMWGNIPDLEIAKKNMIIVAKQLIIVIRKLKEQYGLTAKDFILSGHSYGAHLAGFVGQEEPIGKILGIDPAGGLFTETTPLDERLDAGDADCVEVLHCNAGPCIPSYFALNFTCGTVDYWINGGAVQPSCYEQLFKAIVKQDYVYAIFHLLPPACFHFQCLEYYRASMNPGHCSFIGSECPICRNCGSNGEKCAVMGINTCDCLNEDQKFKSYYLNTISPCPYCGADFFESLLVRLNCYGTEQPGCNTEFIDAYPELAWSYLNLTQANTFFFMFTNADPDKPELMHKCAGELPPDTKFNPACPTEVFIPGYVSGICNFAIYRELKNERLKSGCYNVLLVDYMWGNIPDLAGAEHNLFIVADQLTIVIRNLKERYGLTAKDFILTGHSYGAHLAGFVGQQEPIGKILGIDPAGGPFSESTPLDGRLDAGDADCVEVLHCNAGPCIPEYFAVNFTCGTVDFWINGGTIQESCYEQTLKAFLKQDYIYAFFSLLPPACFHFQCLQYYRASMNPEHCSFIGSECSSCIDCGSNGENCLVMGINTCDCLTENQKFKSYYLNTTLHCPYCNNCGLLNDGYSCAAANITNGITKP